MTLNFYFSCIDQEKKIIKKNLKKGRENVFEFSNLWKKFLLHAQTSIFLKDMILLHAFDYKMIKNVKGGKINFKK